MRKVFVLITCGFLFFVMAGSVSGAEKIRLTLDEAIALGLQNSISLRVKMLAIQSAKTDVQAARASYYPGINGSLTWIHIFDRDKTPSTTIDIPGMTITIPGSYMIASDPVTISAEITQSFYTFGRIKNALKMAQEGVRAAEIDFEEEKRSLTVKIKRAFYGYILAREVMKVQEDNLARKEDALNIARKRYAAGLIPDFEVLSAEVDVESFKPTVITARNEVRYAMLAVMDLLGIEKEGEYELELIGSLEPEYHIFDREKLIQSAFMNNYELRQYQAAINLSSYQRAVASGEKKPLIAGFANYSLQSGFDPETGKNLYWGKDSWNGDFSVGVRAQMQFSSLFPFSRENAQVVKTELGIESQKERLRSAQSRIKMGIESILLKLEEEKAKIASSLKGVELATKLYNSAKERYLHGLIPRSELEDSQTSLNSTQVGYLTAVYGYQSSLFDLADMVGVDHF
ncbi:MAG: TolC family protein [Spirochaetota bacterium]